MIKWLRIAPLALCLLLCGIILAAMGWDMLIMGVSYAAVGVILVLAFVVCSFAFLTWGARDV